MMMTATAATIIITRYTEAGVAAMTEFSRVEMRCDFCGWRQNLATDDDTADMYHPVRLCRDGGCPHCGMPLRLYESGAGECRQEE